MDMEAILAARAARKKGKKKKAIVNVEGIRSVARPEQLIEATQPTMALVTGQELMKDATLFHFDMENDPILKEAQQQDSSSSSSKPAQAGSGAISGKDIEQMKARAQQEQEQEPDKAPAAEQKCSAGADDAAGENLGMFSPLTSSKSRQNYKGRQDDSPSGANKLPGSNSGEDSVTQTEAVVVPERPATTETDTSCMYSPLIASKNRRSQKECTLDGDGEEKANPAKSSTGTTTSQEKTLPQPPKKFEIKESDPYVVPKVGELVSFQYHPNQYHVGVVCNQNTKRGNKARHQKVRFFTGSDENNEGGATFRDVKVLITRECFDKKTFRARPELKPQSRCYDGMSGSYCILKTINRSSGSVHVQYEGKEKQEEDTEIIPDFLVLAAADPGNKDNAAVREESYENNQASPPTQHATTVVAAAAAADDDDDDESEPMVVQGPPMAARLPKPSSLSSPSSSSSARIRQASSAGEEEEMREELSLAMDVDEASTPEPLTPTAAANAAEPMIQQTQCTEEGELHESPQPENCSRMVSVDLDGAANNTCRRGYLVERRDSRSYIDYNDHDDDDNNNNGDRSNSMDQDDDDHDDEDDDHEQPVQHEASNSLRTDTATKKIVQTGSSDMDISGDTSSSAIQEDTFTRVTNDISSAPDHEESPEPQFGGWYGSDSEERDEDASDQSVEHPEVREYSYNFFDEDENDEGDSDVSEEQESLLNQTEENIDRHEEEELSKIVEEENVLLDEVERDIDRQEEEEVLKLAEHSIDQAEQRELEANEEKQQELDEDEEVQSAQGEPDLLSEVQVRLQEDSEATGQNDPSRSTAPTQMATEKPHEDETQAPAASTRKPAAKPLESQDRETSERQLPSTKGSGHPPVAAAASTAAASAAADAAASAQGTAPAPSTSPQRARETGVRKVSNLPAWITQQQQQQPSQSLAPSPAPTTALPQAPAPSVPPRGARETGMRKVSNLPAWLTQQQQPPTQPAASAHALAQCQVAAEAAPPSPAAPGSAAARQSARETSVRKLSNLPAWMTRQQHLQQDDEPQEHDKTSQFDPEPQQSKKRAAVSLPETAMPTEAKKRRPNDKPAGEPLQPANQGHRPDNLGSEDAPICLSDSDSDDEPVIVEPPTKSPTPSPKKSKPHLVHATKLLPKYLKDIGEGVKPFLTNYILQAQIVCPFQNSKLGTRDNDFRAELLDVPSDPESVICKVEGRRLIVAAFQDYLQRWIHEQFVHQQMQDLKADRFRSEVDCFLPRAPFLRLWKRGCIQEVTLRGTTDSMGLWVDFSGRRKGDNELLREFFEPILGTQAMESPGLAVVVLRIEGNEYTSKARWESVRQHFETLNEPEMKVTLVCSSHTNLDGLETDKVEGEVRRTEDGSLPPSEIQLGSVMDVSSLARSVTRRSFSSESKKLGKAGTRRESSAAEHGSSKERKGTSGTQNGAWHTNNAFKHKYKPIYDIEYQRSGVHYQSAMKDMWEKHKDAFGTESCDDDCPCALAMPFLTESVVDLFVARKTKRHPDWRVPSELRERDSPVGFVNHFVPRHQEKVLEAFPDEAPVRTLDRLRKMWSLHLRQRRFGSTCGEECECRDGWSSVFHKGDVLRELTSSPGKKRISSALTTDKVPRKRLRLEGPQNPDEPRHFSLVARSSLLPGLQSKNSPVRDASSVHTKKQGNLTPLQQDSGFRVSFDSRSPLGFYCVTETRGGNNVCKITSLDPYGQCRKRSRQIHVGTQVIAAERKEQSQIVQVAVRGYEDLLRCYNAAKSSLESEITLCFSNVGVHFPAHQPTANTEWTNSGYWSGSCTTGWAGGAGVVPPGIARRTISVASREATNDRAHTGQQTENSWTGTRGRTPGKSILRGPRVSNNRAKKGSPRFSRMHCVKTIRENTVRLPESESWLAAKGEPEAFGNQSLTSEAFSKAMRVLHDRSLPQFLLCLLEELRTGTGMTAEASFHGKNFFDLASQKAKSEKSISRLLKIFRAARQAIHIGQTCKWEHFSVRVSKILDFSLTREGERQSGMKVVTGAVSYSVNGKEKMQQPLPPMEVARVVDYGSGNAAVPEYLLKFNPAKERAAQAEERAAQAKEQVLQAEEQAVQSKLYLRIQLQSASETIDELPYLVIPLEEISRLADQCDERVKVIKELQLGSSGFVNQGVKMQLTIKRITRISNGCKEVTNMLDWMQRFKKEHKLSGEKLNAQICGKDNFSALHAAITFAKPDLVHRVLKLEANPNARSRVGRAVLYARNMLHYAEERRTLMDRQEERNLANDDQFDADGMLAHSRDRRREQLEQRVASLDKIVKDVAASSRLYRLAHGDSDDDPFIHHSPNNSPPNPKAYASQPSSPPPRESTSAKGWECEGGSKNRDPWEAMPKPGSNGNLGANTISTDMFWFLESASSKNSTGEEWVEMTAAEEVFIDQKGSDPVDSIDLFRETRKVATRESLVEWGVLEDEDDFGAEVELCSPDRFDEEAKGAYLRLTIAGREKLAQGPPIEKAGLSSSANVAGSGGSASLHTSTRPDSNSNAVSKRGADIISTDMFWFLESASSKNSTGEEWVEMTAAEKVFSDKKGRQAVDAIDLFRETRKVATGESLVEWGVLEDEDDFGAEVELCSLDRFDEEAKGAYLRLTSAGQEKLADGPPIQKSSPSPSSNVAGTGGSASLGSASLQLSTQSDANANSNSNSRSKRGADTIARDMFWFLESASSKNSTDGEWVEMKAAEKVFSEKEGSQAIDAIDLFRETRKVATRESLVEWGLLEDEDDFGAEVELCSPDRFDEEARGAYLRLTIAGQEELAQGPPIQKAAPSPSTNVAASAAASLSRDSTLLPEQPRVSAVVQTQQRCPNVEAFLGCLVQNLTDKDNHGWVPMGQLVKTFANKYGVNGNVDPKKQTEIVTPDFKKWCEDANGRKFLSWGRADPTLPDGVKLCSYHQVVGHSSDAYLRLTDEGRKVACSSSQASSGRPPSWWHASVAASLQRERPAGVGGSVLEGRASGPQHHTNNKRNHAGVQSDNGSAADSHSAFVSERRASTRRTHYSDERSHSGRHSDHGSYTADSTCERRSSRPKHYYDHDRGASASSERHTTRQGHDSDTVRVTRKYWFLPDAGSAREKCRHFISTSKVRCRHGNKCYFAHIQPSAGRHRLMETEERTKGYVPPLDRTHMQYGEQIYLEHGQEKREFTAAYRDPVSKIYYRSEGGRCAVGKHELCWYPSKKEAKKAVELVYLASFDHDLR